MTRKSAWWAVDLVAIVLYVAAVNVAVGIGLPESIVRAVVVVPLALFAPGYALVAFTFPERYGSRNASFESGRNPLREWTTDQQGLSPLGRFTLSVGVSIVIVPLTVLVLNFVTGIYLTPLLLAVSGETVAFALLALAARRRLPAEERFTPHPSALFGRDTPRPDGQPTMTLGDDRSSSSALTRPMGVLLVVSVVALFGSVAFAAALPMAGIPAPQTTDFTEFYLTTQNESGGYVQTDLPREFSPGQSRPVFITISNDEGEDVRYTVVAKMQQVQNGQVTGERRLQTFSRQVPEDRTVHIRHEIQPRTTGSNGNLRVVYLLYKGDAPDNPTRQNAYRSLRLWITVNGG